MRPRLLLAVVALLALSAEPFAQQPSDPTQLPVRRIALYKSGVGFFEHFGTVTGSTEIAIQFTSGQLDDALNSLTALDLDRGTISAISYNSVAPIEQQLGAMRLPLGENPNAQQFYAALRGSRIEARRRGSSITGRLLGYERRPRSGTGITDVDVITLVADDGAVRTIPLDPDVTVRLVDRDVRSELGRYLSVVAAGRDQDVRRMVLSAAGSGTRRLLVSYISEVPIWKSTYRLVLPDNGTDKPLLQGWAIVDNTVGEDWTNVELSLVAGAPQSFVQRISQPYYTRRTVIPLPETLQRTPQTHEATLRIGSGAVRGVVRDTGGAMLPGVTVFLVDATGAQVARVETDANGQYELRAPSGAYTVMTVLAGFTSTSSPVEIASGTSVQTDRVMSVGRVDETITVSGASPFMDKSRDVRRGGGVVGGVVGALPAAAPSVADAIAQRRQAMFEQPVAATAQELGDLFEYRVSQPVTIRKNQSALVPILSASVTADRLSLWHGAPGSGRPLRAVWLTNATGLTLDGGSFSVIDGNAFAGEGLIQPLKPGEKRIVSYGTDLGVMVDARLDESSGRYTRVTARDGVLIAQQEERNRWVYRVRNEDTTPRTLVIEHQVPSGWTLGSTQAPEETTASAARFRVAVTAKGEATLRVDERRAGDTRYSIEQVDDRLIATFAQRGMVTDVLRRALQPMFDKRAELANADRRVSDLSAQIANVAKDQERVRQNLQALKGSAEEKALVKRYASELNAQEDRLTALRTDLAAATSARDAVRSELSRLIQQSNFTLDVPSTE